MLSSMMDRKSGRRWLAAVALTSLAATAGAQVPNAPAQPSASPPPAPASAAAPQAVQSEQQELVEAARDTLNNFMRDPEMDWLQRNIGRAKGVLIAPAIVKAGWIFGGSGGRAVLLARNETDGRWNGPAFYNVGAASVGFQAGIAVSETLTLVMTDKGLNSLMAPSLKLGGEASVAAGPVGAGAASDITSDFIAFSRSKGVYGGLNLEGSVVTAAEDWNRSYYGRAVTPSAIVLSGEVRNPRATSLATELSRATMRRHTSAAQ